MLVDDTATSYVDTSVAAEARYVYRVKARNSAGLSQQSQYFDAAIPSPPTPTPEPVSITFVENPPLEFAQAQSSIVIFERTITVAGENNDFHDDADDVTGYSNVGSGTFGSISGCTGRTGDRGGFITERRKFRWHWPNPSFKSWGGLVSDPNDGFEIREILYSESDMHNCPAFPAASRYDNNKETFAFL